MIEIKNLKKAAERIKRAIRTKEKIILYGDADLDGAASVVILKESIEEIGGKISAVYFPDREKEGYGITEKALKYLKKLSPALLISLDVGIGNFKEIKKAKKLGFKVIIIDHHEVLGKLPEALIIVDPKQKGESSNFKNLAAAGVALMVSEKILGKMGFKKLKNSFFELAALATIADMMPKDSKNQKIIKQGLKSLETTKRLGLEVFWKIKEGMDYGDSKELLQKIIYALNTSSKKGKITEAYLILTSKNENLIGKIAQNLLKKSGEKRLKIKEIVKEAESRISEKKEEKIIFEGEKKWELTLTGAVASRLCAKYKKPVFIFKKRQKESRGAVRSPADVNSVELMKKCAKFLKTFGGHAPASGFCAENKNLEKFKKCLIKNL